MPLELAKLSRLRAVTALGRGVVLIRNRCRRCLLRTVGSLPNSGSVNSHWDLLGWISRSVSSGLSSLFDPRILVVINTRYLSSLLGPDSHIGGDTGGPFAASVPAKSDASCITVLFTLCRVSHLRVMSPCHDFALYLMSSLACRSASCLKLCPHAACLRCARLQVHGPFQICMPAER